MPFGVANKTSNRFNTSSGKFKPIDEFIGPNLGTFKMNIQLLNRFGVEPKTANLPHYEPPPEILLP